MASIRMEGFSITADTAVPKSCQKSSAMDDCPDHFDSTAFKLLQMGLWATTTLLSQTLVRDSRERSGMLQTSRPAFWQQQCVEVC